MASLAPITDPETAIVRAQSGLFALRDLLESLTESTAPNPSGIAVIIDLLARELPE